MPGRRPAHLDAWNTRQRATAEADLAASLDEAARLRAQGLTWRAVAERLAAVGLRSRTGVPWTPTALYFACRRYRPELLEG